MTFTFTGCGYRRPAQVKTTGTVTLDGEPVAQALHSCLFPTPADQLLVPPTPMENFRLSSFGGNDGLPAGNYRVTATKLILKDKFQKQLYDLAKWSEQQKKLNRAKNLKPLILNLVTSAYEKRNA